MKRIALLILMLLLLGGGGAGGLYAMGMLDEYVDPSEIASEVVPLVASTAYLPMDPFTVPVGEESVQSRAYLKLSMEVRDIATKNDIQAEMPRLRDAIVRELYAQPLPADGTDFVDLEVASRRVQAIADRLFGKGKVVAVLLENVAAIQ